MVGSLMSAQTALVTASDCSGRSCSCKMMAVASSAGQGTAGVVGAIKLMIGLRWAVVAPNIHLRVLNPHIGVAMRSMAALPTHAASLAGNARLGGVSSFGIGGTIAHAILWSRDGRERCKQGANRQLVGWRRSIYMWVSRPRALWRLLTIDQRRAESFAAERACDRALRSCRTPPASCNAVVVGAGLTGACGRLNDACGHLMLACGRLSAVFMSDNCRAQRGV